MKDPTNFRIQTVSIGKELSTNGSDSPENEIQRIQTLNDLAVELTTVNTLDDTLQLVCNKARMLVNADMGFIALTTRANPSGLIIQAISGSASALNNRLVLNASDHTETPAAVANTCAISYPGDTPAIPISLTKQIEKLGIQSGIAGQLQVKSRTFGFIFAGNQQTDSFTHTDTCLISLIGNLLAAEIDRKRSQEDQALLTTAIEQAAESIIITDKKGEIQYVNPAFERISGFRRKEVLGKNPGMLKSGRQDAAFYDQMWQTVNAGKVWHGTFINKRKNGERCDLEATISPVKNEAGQITHFVSVRKDVTSESALRRQLYQAQKMESLGTLAGGIAHDFNNLLMGIQGNVSLMHLELPEDHQARDRCQVIENYVERGASLTKQLLGVARGGKYQAVPTDLNILISANLNMFGRTRKEIRIHEQYCKEPCISKVDPGQIDQVMLNLFVNAWQAMPGGGDLHVKTSRVNSASKKTKPRGLPAGDYIHIVVTDSGIGISKDIQEKIFDPFFTTKHKGRGTGLGLASVYGIIENHKGRVTVRSRKGKGTTFDIYLPESEESPRPLGADHPDIILGQEMILLVDDEKMILDVGRQMLENMGYRVITAQTGQDALSIYKASHEGIHLVILDLIMPGMKGEDIFKDLLKINPEVKVLIASGYGIEESAQYVLSQGAKGFIQKPFSLSKLSKRIRKALT